MTDVGVCVVTGASRGIGRAIADRLARGGRQVVALARSFDDGSMPAGVRTVAGDVTRPADIAAVVDRIHQEDGQIEVLINNAGLYLEQPFGENSPADIAALVSVNVTGLIQMTRACLPDLLHSSGLIVNVASRNVQRAERNQAVYSATKAAVKGFSDSLRLDLQGSGVRVTTLYPGPVNTWGADSSEILLQPDDVADIVGEILAVPGRIEIGELSFGAVR